MQAVGGGRTAAAAADNAGVLAQLLGHRLLGLGQNVYDLARQPPVGAREEADGQAARPGTCCAADAVHVVLRGVGHVVVHHHLDVLDVCGTHMGARARPTANPLSALSSLAVAYCPTRLPSLVSSFPAATLLPHGTVGPLSCAAQTVTLGARPKTSLGACRLTNL